MINTREQVLANYKDLETKGKSGVKVYDQDELICTYQTKKGTVKAVFFTDELNMEKFKGFCKTKNAINAEKVVVYCEYAYVLCPGVLEISLNRDFHSMN